LTEPSKNDVAPGALETVRQFVNSYDVESHTDEIASPEALSTWLAGHDLAAGEATAADVTTFREAREALRALMLANNGAPLDQSAVARLNALADSLELRVRFGPDSTLEPAGEGLEAALGRLIATVHSSMADGTWPRLKACRGDNCQWAFYDHSRNRSGTWCSMEVCGNRAKARTFRARKASAAREQ
jgi:predicted RNA-binding Zn ribbon-like protein